MTLHTLDSMITWIRRRRLRRQRLALQHLLRDLYAQVYQDQLDREQHENSPGINCNAKIKLDQTPR